MSELITFRQNIPSKYLINWSLIILKMRITIVNLFQKASQEVMGVFLLSPSKVFPYHLKNKDKISFIDTKAARYGQ